VAGRRVTVPVHTTAASDALAWAQRERDAGRVEEFSLAPMNLEDVVRPVARLAGEPDRHVTAHR